MATFLSTVQYQALHHQNTMTIKVVVVNYQKIIHSTSCPQSKQHLMMRGKSTFHSKKIGKKVKKMMSFHSRVP